MQAAELLALFADCREDFGRGGIGHAREIDLEEFGEGRAIVRRVEHAVDVIEHLDLARPRVAGGGAEVVVGPAWLAGSIPAAAQMAAFISLSKLISRNASKPSSSDDCG